jgi:N-methylhydantoinase A
MPFTVGIDVGGTFTDLIAVNAATGEVKLAKVPTTVDNQAFGVMNAIRAAGIALADVDVILHGTTATTNAVLERKLAKVGLITTMGFRDSLELGRRTRPTPYGLKGHFEPLISRELRIEIPERMLADGSVHVPLDEAALERAIDKLLAQGCESLVIHFLHSYQNPAHEQRAAALARARWPNAYVSVGHELVAEYREYERGVTAAVNASVQPILARYIATLLATLAKDNPTPPKLLIMQGNGGTVAAEVVAKAAVQTVMSGPASGVMAAVATSRAAGFENVITYDMGHRRRAREKRASTSLLRIRVGIRDAAARAVGGRTHGGRGRWLDCVCERRGAAASGAAQRGRYARADLLWARRYAAYDYGRERFAWQAR